MDRRSLLLLAPGRLEWITEALPAPGAHEVVVRTTAGAISIGTELPQYMGTERVIVSRTYPRMTGYESVGVVLARGAAVRDLEIGGRIVAFYGHRTHAIVADDVAIPIPNEIPDPLALLAILTCDVAKGVRKLNPCAEDPVLVTGAGGIGLLTIWVLRAYGVRIVDVIEPHARRRALARRIGARRAVSPKQQSDHSTAGNYAVGFECSSRDAGFARLQARMAQQGRICVLADGNSEPLTLAPEFHRKELSLVGSSDGWNYREHARWFFERVRGGMPGLEALFEERVAASDLPSTFERMARSETMPVKVLVMYPDVQFV